MGGRTILKDTKVAQVVRYNENNVTYTQGPFVIAHATSGWRIEVELKGHKCPVLPHTSIFHLQKSVNNNWPDGTTQDQKVASNWCDYLNKLVKNGQIKEEKDGLWVCDSWAKLPVE